MEDKHVYTIMFNKNFDDYVQRTNLIYGSYESALKHAYRILESWKETAEKEMEFILSDDRYDMTSDLNKRYLDRPLYNIREMRDNYNKHEIDVIQFSSNPRFIDSVLKVGCLRPIDHNKSTIYWAANIYIKRMRFED